MLVLAFCAGTFACAGGGDDERRPPRIELGNERRDFGRVEQGTAAEAEFGFRNAGDFDLELTELRTADDCVATIDGPARVRPGRTGAIRARFETGAVAGVQERTVTVYSNDPDRRVITLALRADVAFDVAADPPRIWAGVLPRGAALSRTIAVRASEGNRVTAVRTSKPLLDARLVDAVEGGAAATSVGVAIAADAPLGPFDADVEIVTASTRRPVLRVPVSGVIAPDVVVEPARIELVKAAPAPRSFLLMVRNLREARPVRLTGVEIDERLGRAGIETLIEGTRYRVKLELAERPSAGVVRLRTDHPEQSVIEVAVSGEVAGGG